MNSWTHTDEVDHLRRRSDQLINKGSKSTNSSTASSHNDPRVKRKKALYENLGKSQAKR